MTSATMADAPVIRFPASGHAEMPLRRGVNHVLVDVLDSEGKANTFFLDTGASYSLVTSHFVGRTEAVALEQNIETAVGVRGTLPVAPGALIVHDLKVGDVELSRFGAMRMDIPGLDAYMGRPIHGILGFNVLKDWLTIVDYRKERLFLADPDGGPEADWPEPGFVIPFRLHMDAVVLIDGQVNGRATSFVLDIGSSYTVLNARAGALSGIEWTPDSELVEVGEEDPAMDAGVAESLVLGPLAMVRPKVWRFEMPPFAALGLSEPPSAILGNDLLARFKVSIDYRRQELRLWNGKSP